MLCNGFLVLEVSTIDICCPTVLPEWQLRVQANVRRDYPARFPLQSTQHHRQKAYSFWTANSSPTDSAEEPRKKKPLRRQPSKLFALFSVFSGLLFCLFSSFWTAPVLNHTLTACCNEIHAEIVFAKQQGFCKLEAL